MEICIGLCECLNVLIFQRFDSPVLGVIFEQDILYNRSIKDALAYEEEFFRKKTVCCTRVFFFQVIFMPWCTF